MQWKVYMDFKSLRDVTPAVFTEIKFSPKYENLS